MLVTQFPNSQTCCKPCAEGSRPSIADDGRRCELHPACPDACDCTLKDNIGSQVFAVCSKIDAMSRLPRQTTHVRLKLTRSANATNLTKLRLQLHNSPALHGARSSGKHIVVVLDTDTLPNVVPVASTTPSVAAFAEASLHHRDNASRSGNDLCGGVDTTLSANVHAVVCSDSLFNLSLKNNSLQPPISSEPPRCSSIGGSSSVAATAASTFSNETMDAATAGKFTDSVCGQGEFAAPDGSGYVKAFWSNLRLDLVCASFCRRLDLVCGRAACSRRNYVQTQ